MSVYNDFQSLLPNATKSKPKTPAKINCHMSVKMRASIAMQSESS